MPVIHSVHARPEDTRVLSILKQRTQSRELKQCAVDWMKHTLAYCNDEGEVTIDYRPIHYHTLDAEEQDSFPPKARVY